MVGCSSGETAPVPLGAPAAKESLIDLAGLLKYLKEENRSPPAKVADIEPVEPLFQAAYLGLIRNDIVYVWGASIDPAAGDKVLAYEKGVESSSGWVLMQDGSVETMQASAFQAAPKATK
jgi:hypothetical protein